MWLSSSNGYMGIGRRSEPVSSKSKQLIHLPGRFFLFFFKWGSECWSTSKWMGQNMSKPISTIPSLFFFSHPHLSAPSAPPGLISRWTNWAQSFLWPPWGAWDSPASRPTKSRLWRLWGVHGHWGNVPIGGYKMLQHTLPFRSISQQSGAERWVGGILLQGGYDVN